MVGTGEVRSANVPGISLVTYALGSCIAIAVHDPLAKVAGLLHLMLPESSVDPSKAQESPGRFADTGVPALLREACAAGASKRRLVVYLAGGAQVIEDQGIFNIGKRNHLAARKLLWREGVIVHGEAVGGRESRSVRLEVDTGRFFVRTAAGAERLLEGKPHGVVCPDC